MGLEDIRTRDSFKNVYPESDYTPEKRRLEYKFISETKKAINKLNISERRKKSARELLNRYMIKYEENYVRVQIEREKRARMINGMIYSAMTFQN